MCGGEETQRYTTAVHQKFADTIVEMGLGICANKRTFETWMNLEIPENAKGTYQPRAGTSHVRSVVQGVKLQLKEGKAVALSWLLAVHKHLSRQTVGDHHAGAD